LNEQTRTVGIDLALKNPHRAFIRDEAGRALGKSFSVPRTAEGFKDLLEKATAGLPEETKITAVMEPTSLAWVPLATYLALKGHIIYLVNPRRVSDLRKFYSRHTKSDRLDAKVLSNLPNLEEDILIELSLPTGEVNGLKRYCQQRDKLERSIGAQKNRIQAIFTEANPKVLEALGEDKFSRVGRAFLRKYINPLKVKGLGVKRFGQVLQRKAHGQLKESTVERLFEACCDTITIYREALEKDELPFSYDQLQEEINLELDLMEFKESQVKKLDQKISEVYRQIDPRGDLKSIKGIGDVHAPIVMAFAGNINRFGSNRSYCGSTGLTPGKKQTGNTDRKGLKISKEGPNLLKKTYYMIGETARHWDLEMAERYHRLIGRGLHHKQAIVALGRSSAARVRPVNNRARWMANAASRPNTSSRVTETRVNIQVLKKARQKRGSVKSSR
jgi:transposase